ncbi:UNVERIFIED_CONTAM: hypothetical protein FKN15_060137 [Acipenser sinensis]
MIPVRTTDATSQLVVVFSFREPGLRHTSRSGIRPSIPPRLIALGLTSGPAEWDICRHCCVVCPDQHMCSLQHWEEVLEGKENSSNSSSTLTKIL